MCLQVHQYKTYGNLNKKHLWKKILNMLFKVIVREMVSYSRKSKYGKQAESSILRTQGGGG